MHICHETKLMMNSLLQYNERCGQARLSRDSAE